MAKLVSANPGRNYEIVGEIEISSKREIKQKVDQAEKAHNNWKSLGVKERIRFLKRIYVAFSKKKAEIGELATREIGMMFQDREVIDINAGLDYFKWYLDNAEKYLAPEVTFEDKRAVHKVFFEPIGVAGVIVPWNFPFCNFIWGVIPNLIAGNTVIFKHSEECPLSGKLYENIIRSCKLPKGVFSEIYGDGEVGNFLVHQGIDLICFTGSAKVGQYLYQVASKKFIKVILELGGSAPGIVFADADIDKVVESVWINRFGNCGQICDGLKRLIAHQSKFDQVVKALKKMLEDKKVSDPQNPATEIGPLVSRKQLKTLEEQVKDALNKGAEVITGGNKPKGLKGAYYLPTLLTRVNKKMKVWQEEVFGPVLPIVPFKTEKEAIDLANDTQYGLGGYIFTKDKRRAERVAKAINTGMVNINSVSYLLPCNPFGGNKLSGIGREHGKYGLRDLCKIKVVAFEK
ncbi:MAG: aldehyde dehydrogenase family protein [Candidatus Shapirobacteria bacterium]